MSALPPRIARARYRAWHRGTREADYIVGGFFDQHYASWDDGALAWFEALLDEQDVDIIAWALGAAEPPPQYLGAQLDALRRLDYVRI
jgi:antitoxin CptB